MKKKIAIIIAILLCVVLVFTCVACKKKDKNKTTEVTINATTEDQAAMQTQISNWLDSWLLANAQEEGAVTNQKKSLLSDLKKQEAAFSFTNSDKTPAAPTYNVSYKNGRYTIEVTWSKDLKQTFTKDAKTVEYKNWAGKYSRPEDDWLLETKASGTVDKMIEAGVNTINYVTGNAVTGKFGADGTIGVCVAGKTYGLRIKGNFDGTTAANNEAGLVLVDGEGNELFGLYYKAAPANSTDPEKDSKLYLQWNKTNDDGTEETVYKYIEYADIYGFVEGLFPRDEQTKEIKFPAANNGALTFKDEDDAEIEVDGLASLLKAAGAGKYASVVNAVINMVAKHYVHDGRYYIDINLGSVMAQLTDITSTITVELDFLEKMGIDLANMKGLLGHITLSAAIDDNSRLSGFELALNIPECDFYLNGKPANDGQLMFHIPAISFALYFDDFSFLTTGKVQNVIPAGTATAAKFSPTNIDVSGQVYINHTEDGVEKLNDTFHFAFMTDINPLEIVAHGYASTAKAALVIKQSQGETYNEAEATNFLSISYEQADRLLCVSGTAFDMEDNGEQVYYFDMSDKDQAMRTLKRWLGLWDPEGETPGNYHGLTIDDTLGLIITNQGAAYESAKEILNDQFIADLIKYFVQKKNEKANKAAGNGGNGSGAVAEAPEFNIDSIGDYFDAFKDLYDEFVEAKAIDVQVENGELAVKAEVTCAMINKVIGVINDTFGTEWDDVKAADVDDIKVYINYKLSETVDYTDMFYATVKVKGNTYLLVIDNSVAKTFKIDFTLTTSTNRVYAFNFTAVNGVQTQSATKWTASVTFDIKNSNNEVVNHTLVTLSDFHASWGTDNSTKILALIPDKENTAAMLPIFPEDNIPSVGTNLVKKVKSLLTDSTKPAVKTIAEFIIRQVVDNN